MKNRISLPLLPLAALLATLTFSSTAAAQTKESVLHNFGVSSDGALPQGELMFDKAGNLYGVTGEGGTHAAGVVFKLSPVSGSWQETVIYNFCSAANCADGLNPIGGLLIDEKGNLYGTTNEGGANNGGEVFELSPTATGWKQTVLYSFCAQRSCSDGRFPNARITRDSVGNIYGTAGYGGTGSGNGNGVAFKLSHGAHGWTESVLYTFCQQTNCTDGSQPLGGLVMDRAGNLYGTTSQGGSGLLNCDKFKLSCGVVYELTPGSSGWTENVLYNFCTAAACADGGSPQASMILDAQGNLYGTALGGGNPACQDYAHGCGLVFKLSPSGSQWSESVLYTFLGSTDGATPFAPLVMDSKGNLSGTAFLGGDLACDSGMGCGVVFQLSPASDGSWSERVRHAFTGGNDGSFPLGGLTADSAGHLYGSSNLGGSASFGVIFELH